MWELQPQVPLCHGNAVKYFVLLLLHFRCYYSIESLKGRSKKQFSEVSEMLFLGYNSQIWLKQNFPLLWLKKKREYLIPLHNSLTIPLVIKKKKKKNTTHTQGLGWKSRPLVRAITSSKNSDSFARRKQGSRSFLRSQKPAFNSWDGVCQWEG